MIERNKYGVNNKIKARVLDEEVMKNLGFTDYREGYWHFMRILRDYIRSL